MKYFLFSVLMILLISCQSEVIENKNNQMQIEPEIVKPENCFCTEQPMLSVHCDSTFLSDNSFLYYQFTCDSIWLTLETPTNQKKILKTFNLTTDLPEYHYRLHYQLEKEYPNHLLF